MRGISQRIRRLGRGCLGGLVGEKEAVLEEWVDVNVILRGWLGERGWLIRLEEGEGRLRGGRVGESRVGEGHLGEGRLGKGGRVKGYPGGGDTGREKVLEEE